MDEYTSSHDAEIHMDWTYTHQQQNLVPTLHGLTHKHSSYPRCLFFANVLILYCVALRNRGEN